MDRLHSDSTQRRLALLRQLWTSRCVFRGVMVCWQAAYLRRERGPRSVMGGPRGRICRCCRCGRSIAEAQALQRDDRVQKLRALAALQKRRRVKAMVNKCNCSAQHGTYRALWTENRV